MIYLLDAEVRCDHVNEDIDEHGTSSYVAALPYEKENLCEVREATGEREIETHRHTQRSRLFNRFAEPCPATAHNARAELGTRITDSRSSPPIHLDPLASP
jgi:hypothetical protein